MDEFFKTRMGRKFYEADVPRIATALEKIASELDRANTDKALAVDVGPTSRPFCDLEECEERAAVCRCKAHARSFVELVWVIQYNPNNGFIVCATPRAAGDQMLADLSDPKTEFHNRQRAEIEAWVERAMTEEKDEWDLAAGQFTVSRSPVRL